MDTKYLPKGAMVLLKSGDIKNIENIENTDDIVVINFIYKDTPNNEINIFNII